MQGPAALAPEIEAVPNIQRRKRKSEEPVPVRSFRGWLGGLVLSGEGCCVAGGFLSGRWAA
jgi:hypothetical protein